MFDRYAFSANKVRIIFFDVDGFLLEPTAPHDQFPDYRWIVTPEQVHGFCQDIVYYNWIQGYTTFFGLMTGRRPPDFEPNSNDKAYNIVMQALDGFINKSLIFATATGIHKESGQRAKLAKLAEVQQQCQLFPCDVWLLDDKADHLKLCQHKAFSPRKKTAWPLYLLTPDLNAKDELQAYFKIFHANQPYYKRQPNDFFEFILGYVRPSLAQRVASLQCWLSLSKDDVSLVKLLRLVRSILYDQILQNLADNVLLMLCEHRNLDVTVSLFDGSNLEFNLESKSVPVYLKKCKEAYTHALNWDNPKIAACMKSKLGASTLFFESYDPGMVPVQKNEAAFKDACARIENDGNYRPDITNEKMWALAVDRSVSKVRINMTIAIYPVTGVVKPPKLGRIYLLKVLVRAAGDLNENFAIYVDHSGETTIHDRGSVRAHYFKTPIVSLSIEHFLSEQQCQLTP